MKFLESLADAFIMTFGITPPMPERRRVAAIFIGSGLLLTVPASWRSSSRSFSTCLCTDFHAKSTKAPAPSTRNRFRTR